MMMETGPAAAFEYTEDAAHRRGVERLRAHALVSPRHYTAHPYSSDALFAVLSGTYPHGRRLLLEDLAAPEVNGLFSGLPADVGLRGVYLPSLYQIELDDRMYGAFGARTLYVADRHPDDPLRARAVMRADALLRDLGGDRMNASRPRSAARPADRRSAGARAPEGGHRPHHRRAAAATRSCSSRRSGTGRGPSCCPATPTCWPAGGC